MNKKTTMSVYIVSVSPQIDALFAKLLQKISPNVPHATLTDVASIHKMMDERPSAKFILPTASDCEKWTPLVADWFDRHSQILKIFLPHAERLFVFNVDDKLDDLLTLLGIGWTHATHDSAQCWHNEIQSLRANAPNRKTWNW